MNDYRSRYKLISARFNKLNQELEELVFEMETDLGFKPARTSFIDSNPISGYVRKVLRFCTTVREEL